MSEDTKRAGPELPTCAAIRIEISGMLVAGKRHDECYKHLAEHGIKHFPATPGFMTNRGRFVDRKVAMDLAVAANMKSCYSWDGSLRGDVLFSEDLY